MADRIQFRRDTAARWSSINPILMEGEIGLETDTNHIKIGNGSSAWNNLEYGKGVVNLTNELGTSSDLAVSQLLAHRLSKADNYPICANNQNFGMPTLILANAVKASIIDIAIQKQYISGKNYILQKYGQTGANTFMFVQEVNVPSDIDAVITFDASKSFYFNIPNNNITNYHGINKFDLHKSNTDSTIVGYIVIDVDLINTYNFYISDNLTYRNSHIIPREIPNNLTNELPNMFVKKEAKRGLDIYCKLTNGLYLRYPLTYREKDGDGLGEEDAHIFYHNYGLFPLGVYSVDSDLNTTKKYDIFREAEIEVAIAVYNKLGHMYFVGGYFHGFENIVDYDKNTRNVQILIDNKRIAEDEAFSGACSSVKVYQKSRLYNCGYGTEDEIAMLDKLWEFDDGKFVMDNTITISKDREIIRGFGNMFPVYRHHKGSTSEKYLTNKRIKGNNIYKVDDQSDGWDASYSSSLDYDCKSIIQYGEIGFGFSVEQSDKNVIDKTGGMYTITNGSIYNKTYTAFMENNTAKEGDVFRIRNAWNFYYDE